MSPQESTPPTALRRAPKKKQYRPATHRATQKQPAPAVLDARVKQPLTKNTGSWQNTALYKSWLSFKQSLTRLFGNKPPQQADTATRKTGVVKFFSRSKGFGFIQEDNGNEIYVHVSGLMARIRENDKVTFVTQPGKKGLSAVKVKLA